MQPNSQLRTRTKLIHGIGTNDAPYAVSQHKGRRCPIYDVWRHMLGRCYSTSVHAKQPTYIGCSVAPEWHSFMAFRAWVLEQNWQAGRCLDKDILFPGNKLYGPSTCVFVDSATNNLLIDSRAARGDHPLGVHWHKEVSKFHAQVCNPATGKREHLGYFVSAAEAHATWQRRKAEIIVDVALPQPDVRVRDGLLLRTQWLREARHLGLETIDFNGPAPFPWESAA